MRHRPRRLDSRRHDRHATSTPPLVRLAIGTVRVPDILIVTEHRLFADALRRLLAEHHAAGTVAVARPGTELNRVGARLRPDVVLLDAYAAHAPDVACRLRRWYPDAALLCVADDGASGAPLGAAAGEPLRVVCARTVEELVGAIGEATAVRDGNHRAIDTRCPARIRHAPEPSLSAREREIVALLDSGLANKEIAERLGITLATAKNHVHHILAKLAVRSRGKAAARVRGAVSGDD